MLDASRGPYSTRTLAQAPALVNQVDSLMRVSWPEFLFHGDVPSWEALCTTFRDFQILLCDPDDTVIAVAHTVPFRWMGNQEDLPTTINEILERAIQANREGPAPTTLAALAAMVTADRRGEGLSAALVRAMVSLAGTHGLDSLLAPVRPTLKSSYPRMPMEQYVDWKRTDGSPFDPWIRVHWRMKAERLRIEPNTLIVEGTVAEWESWTGMRFPETGFYAVPGALQPVTIDRERDRGRYEDPNLWMRHAVPAANRGASRILEDRAM